MRAAEASIQLPSQRHGNNVGGSGHAGKRRNTENPKTAKTHPRDFGILVHLDHHAVGHSEDRSADGALEIDGVERARIKMGELATEPLCGADI